MYFSVLGPLTASTAEGRPVEVPEAKVRALLAALLVHEGRPVSVDRLVDDLWGDRLPANPAGALQTKVSRLRRALALAEPGAEALVESRAPGYLLRAARQDVDVHRFADLTAAAHRTEDLRVRAELLTEALALWKGDAFADVGDAESIRTAAERLAEQRLSALEALAETRLDLGEHHALIGELGELAVRHPLRERLRALQLRALYLAGRQSEALAAYTELRRRLADELGVDPGPELTALHQAILEHDTALAAASAPPRRSQGNLTRPLTDLVGRTEAVAAVRELLTTHRLVTLTGPAGVGKTRLAEEAAGQAAGAYPDGVRVVGLAGSAEVAEQLSAALGIREEASVGLEDALRPRRLLLVLDNCEHVIESAADVVGRLLATAPGLSVLATSREPLGLAGETVWTVPPLPQADAERLFELRASAAVPGFSVSEENAAAVATVCRRLDRIPLALELAATRVRALGVHELSARLDDRFRLLAGGNRGVPPRQRTLRAMIDWSWELLGDDERMVLRRLAVFADGCTLDAAEAVCGGHDVLDPLIRLVDRSLVTVAEGPRYRLPESVAAYAVERLAEAGESDALRLRHRAHYAELAERSAAALHGPDQQDRLTRLDQESANLRTALEQAVRDGDGAGALRMALDLTWYWFLRGRLAEARRSLDETLLITGDDHGSPHAQAVRWRDGFTLLAGAGAGAGGGGRFPAAEEAADDRAGLARARWFLGYALLSAGEDLARSESLVERALADLRADGDRWGTAAAQSTRATQALLRGDLASARASAADGHALFEALGDRWGRLQTAYPLAALATIAGDYPHAARLHQSGLDLAEELGFWTDAADRLTALGRVALLTGDLAGAAELHRRAMTMAAEHGYPAGKVHAEIGLALGARRQGDFDLAERHLRATLAWHREVEFGPGPALLLAELGFLAEQRGDAAGALALHHQGAEAARATGDPRAVALAEEGLAGAYALMEEPVRAARLLGAATRARESVGAPLPEAERGDVDRISARARGALGAEAFAAAFSAGADERS
ncbi:BTAD domain-containing putative transcriptional regulator [Actinopolymorpha pittospori]|uniref:ATPase/DNA-binding winged helix-turn-helix (WHTH) protein n=1 Tax=Actinopolymorpha pittospori TaxID=648752 RepID=A0A927N0B9_9ACTN|nr:BTAD domain-containing putative transcriptional regulator [Actinopolymorpha pittospori]MBE1610280.1 putative ATPase/DNA-binding winged helix-turn-helix (wHTH) protein [Actinopolymorpha pittospori]